MGSGSRLIWMQLGRAEDGAVLNGYEHPTVRLSRSPGPCRLLRGICRPAVRLPSSHDSPNDRPDRRPVLSDGVSNTQHARPSVLLAHLFALANRLPITAQSAGAR